MFGYTSDETEALGGKKLTAVRKNRRRWSGEHRIQAARGQTDSGEHRPRAAG